jgi:hypothetical protein
MRFMCWKSPRIAHSKAFCPKAWAEAARAALALMDMLKVAISQGRELNMSSNYSEFVMGRLNRNLGGGHRVKPYDLSSANDLSQALLTSVAAFRDYTHYRDTLMTIGEDYDETLEYCDTAAWLDLSMAPGRVDELIAEGEDALASAAEVFSMIADRAKDNCANVVKAALSAHPFIQKTVLGRSYNIKPEEMDEKISDLLEFFQEDEYCYAMPDNLKAFLKLMEMEFGKDEE